MGKEIWTAQKSMHRGWGRPEVMEQKQILLSALSLGIGVSVGLTLASGQTMSRWTGLLNCSAGAITEAQLEHELRGQVVDGKESKITFEEFPYILSKQTRGLLTSAAHVHLRLSDFSKHTQKLMPAGRAILLSGPAELYQRALAKALAQFFEAKLLLLDVNDFSLKMQSKYGCPRKEYSSKKSIPETTLKQISGFLGSFSILPQREETKDTLSRQSTGANIKSKSMDPPQHCGSASTSSNASTIPPNMLVLLLLISFVAHIKCTSSWAFDEKHLLQSLYKVLVSVSETCSMILYIRDVDKLLLQSDRFYKLFRKMLDKLSGSVLILGSRMLDPDDEDNEMDERVSLLFPCNIEIEKPEDETHLDRWEAQLKEETKVIQFQDNKNYMAKVLAANDLDCDDLGSICYADPEILSDYTEEIVISAISYHLLNNKDPEYRNGKLVISSKSLSHGLSLFQEDAPNAESKVFPRCNEFESRIRPEVIPPNRIGVTFDDIGALDDIKESLEELVMFPLQRPEIFKGGLLKPCRGILLFGPPGTGKTMLAKAMANEAGASFINVSMSTITSKWFGEDEKNVRALFTLAAKISPTIIFVDEVDSMLGQRLEFGEDCSMRKIKNEFMTHWDGLLTKAGERVLVLAATNRPFDLDEAIIRRFDHRIMVGLPSVESREMILKTLLAKEQAEDLDFKELATMTEGYTGSDLKNLCMAAAYRPVRELAQQERMKKDKKKKQKADEGKSSEDASDTREEAKGERVIVLRPLNMEDMRQAKNQVAASFASDGAAMNKLKQWNELYGEGGSRKKEQLTYFL
uniref:AAA+ ATPase domain-containing protein n=1 Tax=Vitis vinifera TaxID=29760 RepID=F6H6J7_VITVI